MNRARMVLAFLVLVMVIAPSASFPSASGAPSKVSSQTLSGDPLTGGQLTLQSYSFAGVINVPVNVVNLTGLATQGTSMAVVSGSYRLALSASGTDTVPRIWAITGFTPSQEMNLTFSAEYTGAWSSGPFVYMAGGTTPWYGDFAVNVGYNNDKLYYNNTLLYYQYSKALLVWHNYKIHYRPNYTYDVYRDGSLLRAYVQTPYIYNTTHYGPMYSSWFLYIYMSGSLGAGTFYLDYINQTVAQRVVTPIMPSHLALGFDDGNATVYSTAYPLMSTYGFMGTAFINGATIGTSPKLSWSQVASLESAGWGIGDHAYTHVVLTALTLTQADYQIYAGKQSIVQNTTYVPTLWAAPYTAFNFPMDAYAFNSLGLVSRDQTISPLTYDSSNATGTPHDSRRGLYGAFSKGTAAALELHVVSNTTPPTCYICTSWTDFNYILSTASALGYRLLTYPVFLQEAKDANSTRLSAISTSPWGFAFSGSYYGRVVFLDSARANPILARVGETNSTTLFGSNGNRTILEIGAGSYGEVLTIGGASMPTGALVKVSNWEPSFTTGHVLDFTISNMNAGTRWFNVSGLIPGATYNVTRDGNPIYTLTANSTGAISFAWASWSAHQFAVIFSGSPSVVPNDVTIGIWIFIFLLLAYVVLLIIAWYDDSVAWFIPAGIVMQLIAFQGWTVTSSLPVAISLSVVGIVTLLVPIGHALRGKPS